MALKVTITSTKGGVGKTANLGRILADLGQRVLEVFAVVGQPRLLMIAFQVPEIPYRRL